MRTSLATMPPIKTACSTAYATHLVVSATPCQVLRVYASIKHDAANGVYFLQVIDSATAVNAGGAITLIAVKEVNHKQNEAELFDFEFGLGGVRWGQRVPDGVRRHTDRHQVPRAVAS